MIAVSYVLDDLEDVVFFYDNAVLLSQMKSYKQGIMITTQCARVEKLIYLKKNIITLNNDHINKTKKKH